MNEHCRHAICEFEGDGHNGTLAHTTTFSAVSHIRIFFSSYLNTMETISPLASDIHIIYYTCVCVCLTRVTAGNCNCRLCRISRNTYYAAGSAKIILSVLLEIVSIWVSRRLRSPDGTHTHNFAGEDPTTTTQNFTVLLLFD